MQTGIDLEPYAVKEYESIFDIKVQGIGFVEPENEFTGWVGISPDGFINTDGLIEIKCPKAKTHLKYIKKNQLPSIYKPQVQSQLWVTEKKYCDFMSYVPGMKPFIIRVFPDIEYFNKIETEVRIAITTVEQDIKTYREYDYLK